MGGVGGSFSKQKSSGNQSSESGLSGEDRAAAADLAFENIAKLSNDIASFKQGGPSLLNLNQSGLTPGAANLAGDLVQKGVTSQFNKLSAGGAARGQLSPKNTSGIIGSATERAVASALPQFINQASQNELFNVQAPQQFALQGMSQFKDLISLIQNLTEGSSSRGNQKSSGFSAGGNVAVA